MADCTWDIFRPMNMPSGRASCGTCCTARSAYVSTSSSSFKSSCRSHRAAMRNKTFLAIPTGAPRKPLLQESPSTGLQYLAGKESSSRSAYLSSRNSYMLTTWVVQSSAGQGSPTPSRRCSQKDANDSSGGGAMRRMAAATTSRPESRFGKPWLVLTRWPNRPAQGPAQRTCTIPLGSESRGERPRQQMEMLRPKGSARPCHPQTIQPLSAPTSGSRRQWNHQEPTRSWHQKSAGKTRPSPKRKVHPHSPTQPALDRLQPPNG
mmetsp:Transcript_118397/g.379580  ORF Transcript_118397/g.379580 Transcript_118397/m.379580 type:complete len:263 (+) Transcript_118397:418-1206(+)